MSDTMTHMKVNKHNNITYLTLILQIKNVSESMTHKSQENNNIGNLSSIDPSKRKLV